MASATAGDLAGLCEHPANANIVAGIASASTLQLNLDILAPGAGAHNADKGFQRGLLQAPRYDTTPHQRRAYDYRFHRPPPRTI
jgi:hypothetical protein